MKPAPFDYLAARTVDEAVAALGPGAHVLAGGQSLIPLLNARAVRPRLLVDVNGIAELDGLRRRGDALRIGAVTRQSALERAELVAAGWPLLRDAVRHVGHAATRSRGTVGGSVAHGDPLAELPAALLALEARIHVRGPDGARVIDAVTALRPGELLVEIEVPAPPAGARMAFSEHVDTANGPVVAGAAVVLARQHAAIALIGGGPQGAAAAERALLGGAGPRLAARLAAADVADERRQAVMAEIVRRAIEAALA